MTSKMAHTGLLVVTSLSRVSNALTKIRHHVSTTLYIQLYPGFQTCTQRAQHLMPAPLYGKTITNIYVQAISKCKDIDVRVLVSNIKYPQQRTITRKPIDVVIFDSDIPQPKKTDFILQYLNKNVSTIVLNKNDESSEDTSLCEVENASDEMYDNTVIGGTFDRIHIGHKILLTEAIIRARKRIIVGVTDKNMIKSKKLYELILPVEHRIADVEEFLTDIDPSVKCEVVPIQDPYGPTKFDPNLQMIIVSTETLKGGEKVNEVRLQNKLPPLKIFCINLIQEVEHGGEGKEDKISSSNQRMNLLGTRLVQPEFKSNLPKRPYLIGLAGGIASGKTAITTRLEKLGAGVISCDLIAHELYKPGNKCHTLIKQNFGLSVINQNNEVNRQALGALVFNDKEKLDRLNSLMWPAILEETKVKIKELYRRTKREVIIIEAAVLLKANWDKEFHEIWSCMIPPDEAIKRMQERNNLTTEEATARLEAQPANEEYVARSNIVFCTFWSPEYTQTQVEKAWDAVQRQISKL